MRVWSACEERQPSVPRVSLLSHASVYPPRCSPNVAASSIVAVVLCAPPLGLMTTIVLGPSKVRRTDADAARRRRSTLPGPGLIAPNVTRRMPRRQPCSAGPPRLDGVPRGEQVVERRERAGWASRAPGSGAGAAGTSARFAAGPRGGRGGRLGGCGRRGLGQTRDRRDGVLLARPRPGRPRRWSGGAPRRGGAAGASSTTPSGWIINDHSPSGSRTCTGTGWPTDTASSAMRAVIAAPASARLALVTRSITPSIEISPVPSSRTSALISGRRVAVDPFWPSSLMVVMPLVGGDPSPKLRRVGRCVHRRTAGQGASDSSGFTIVPPMTDPQSSARTSNQTVLPSGLLMRSPVRRERLDEGQTATARGRRLGVLDDRDAAAGVADQDADRGAVDAHPHRHGAGPPARAPPRSRRARP